MNTVSVSPDVIPRVVPVDDRFASQLKDLKANAAFGISVDDVLTAESKGQHNEWRSLQLQVRREFFSMKQVFVVIYWAIIIGMFVGVLVMSFVVPGLRWNNQGDTIANTGVFLLSMGISNMISGTQTYSGLKKCTSDKHAVLAAGVRSSDENAYIVDANHRGHECLHDMDCTIGKHLLPDQYGMCRHDVSKVRWVSNRAGFVIFIAGFALTLTTFTNSTRRPPPADLVQSVVYGIFGGVIQALIFS